MISIANCFFAVMPKELKTFAIKVLPMYFAQRLTSLIENSGRGMAETPDERLVVRPEAENEGENRKQSAEQLMMKPLSIVVLSTASNDDDDDSQDV